MSIKKLFDSTDKSKNYLSDTDQKEAFSDIESYRNLEELSTKAGHHVPHIDYSEPDNFVRYGSARLYYQSALNRIVDYYPYDGSKAEINSFYNKSLDIEKYILNNLYPRTNGYAIFSADGWGTKTSMASDGYGIPATPEAIIILGGPNATTGELKDLISNPKNDKFQYSNIYDENIYRTAGLPSDYGKGTRESNLRANLDDGVTVEFWLKTGSFSDGTATETLKQVVLDLWNKEDYNSNAYGRITIELTGAVHGDAKIWGESPFLITVQSGSTTGSFQQTIGKNIVTASLGEWNHYAFTLYNSGSTLVSKLHVNGALNHELISTPGVPLAAATAAVTFGDNSPSAYDDETITLQSTDGTTVVYTLDDDASTNTYGTNTTNIGIQGGPNGIWITGRVEDAIANSSNAHYGKITAARDSAAAATATIVFANAAMSRFDDETFTVESTDGTTVVYTLDDDSSTNTYGASTTNIGIQGGPSVAWLVGRVEDAIINSSNAHYGKITASKDGDTLTLTQAISGQPGNTTVSTSDPDDITVSGFTGGTGTKLTLTQVVAGVPGNTTVSTSDSTDITVSGFTGGTATDTALGGELPPKNMIARIGSLLTGAAAPGGRDGIIDAGKLNGSIDEFRYWKAARTDEEIGKNWIDQVGGGANTDISNTTLGVYYKFNEGIVGDAAIDGTVLDYGGRISNGTWYGYTSNSRNTGSAIISASAATREYEDPIIRREHPDFISLDSELTIKGEDHDINNNTSVLSLLPGWILEQEEYNSDSDLQNICHIMGAYFDKLYLQISELPKFHYATYPSASQKPVPFAQHFPQSLGLYTPELFIDSTVLEKFVNRNKDTLFESNLQDTKNLIYTNLYNNLTNIYKSKGTEKAIKNVFKCLNVDDRLIKLVINSNNREVELNNNYEQTLINKNCLNFNRKENTTAVLYQRLDPSNDDARGYITNLTRSSADSHGCTAEANIVFPYYLRENDEVTRDYTTVSLFGMYTVDTSDADSKTGADPSFIGGYGIGSSGGDVANFQVYAIKESESSRNIYFKLSSSNLPIPFPIDSDNVLTSSMFMNTYNNEEWNISVRLKPTKYPLANFVEGAAANEYTYEVIFSGIQTHLGEVLNSFKVSASIGQISGSSFLNAAKRMYIGAERNNLTGDVLHKSDILVNNVRYWAKYLEDSDLTQHTHDVENMGISGSYRALSPLDTGSVDILNSDTLVLDWNFTDVTSSRSNGTWYIQDFSSGSATRSPTAPWTVGGSGVPWSWIEHLAGYQHTGYGYGFPTSSADVVEKRAFNTYKLTDPERAVSSDMVRIFYDDYEPFYRDDNIPNYIYTIEKSFYNVVSEQMMEFFAGIIDFNNLIGAPVNKYRDRYKDIEKLRRTFFKRVTSVTDIEKYIEYYKWFDDSITTIISQLIPASSEFVDDVLNMVESHVLERNKYRSKFPTLHFEHPEVESFMKGFTELLYPWFDGSSTTPSSPRPTNTHKTYWLSRAERDATEITSGDSTVDTQRQKYKNIITSVPHMSASLPTFSLRSGTKYVGHKYPLRAFARTVRLQIDDPTIRNYARTIKGGTNFSPQKDIDFALTALRPAGPVNRESNIFVPRNVLLGLTQEMVEIEEIIDPVEPNNFISKKKRVFKVQHGRDWEDGVGYKNVKSTIAFPFNVVSSSVTTGYNKAVVDKVTGGIEITNIHNDVYGDDKERPMQGTFTERVVGGHQSRHINLNTGSDDWLSRPEAWKILLGTCPGTWRHGTWPTGAIGMVGPDYPSPEANEIGITPYPVTGAQKAVYYRDFIAKRPVNIKNIKTLDVNRSTTVPGNYEQEYEVVNSFSTFDNPRRFVENQPTLPAEAFNNNVTGATQIRTILDTHRTDENHTELMSEYSTEYFTLTGTVNKTIVVTRFAAPGGVEVMSKGYLDFRSSEFSVYNSLNNRNLSVFKPSQGPSGTLPEPAGDGPTGIRVYDIHGKDYGLRAHRARHTARFGRDSLFVTSAGNLPGAEYDQLPGFHKIHRNNLARLKKVDSITSGLTGASLSNTQGILWTDPSDGANSGNCLAVQATSSDGQNAANALIFDNSLTGSAAEFPVWTFSAWINPSSSNAARIIWDAGQSSVGSETLHTITVEGDEALRYQARTSADPGAGSEKFTFWETAASAITNGSWNHIVVSVTGTIGSLSSTLKPTLYVNGVSKSWDGATSPSLTPNNNLPNGRKAKSNFRSHAWTQTPPITIGGDWSSADYEEYYGAIDEVAIWNSQLTDVQVTSIYNSGKPCDLTHSSTPATDSLIAWWRLGEGDGTNADATNTGNAAGTAMGANNIVRDLVGSASLCPTAKSGKDLTLDIRPSSLEGCDNRVNSYSEAASYNTSSLYDNDFVQHQIPQTDIQYAWISGAIRDPDSTRYFEFQRTYNEGRRPYHSDSSGYTSYFNFVSESDVSYDRAPLPGWTQPTVRINNLVLDPISGSTNTVGFPADVNVSSYINSVLNPGLANTNYLNLLLTQRADTFGWTWRKLRQQNNPIFIDEGKKSVLSMMTGSNKALNRFRLATVSSRGRPALINFDAPFGAKNSKQARNNMTLKVTDNNERILFNEVALNNYININLATIQTPLTQLIRINKNPKNNFKLNWILYTQNLFPSERNEYMSGTYKRLDYDNGYWRMTGSQRIELGTEQSGAFSYNINSSFIGRSSWPLDAPENFLTRTRPFNPDVDGAYIMQKSGNAGELQNVHFSYVTSGQTNVGNLEQTQVSELWPAALYARKHMMAAPRSVVAPSGIENSKGLPDSDGVNFYKNYSVQIYSGEAEWDAPRQAGVVRKGTIPADTDAGIKGGDKISIYEVTASEPWYATYDDFYYEMGLFAKDYSVVPEFRISEHIEDYVKYGMFNPSKTDTFEVPGVSGSANSSTSSFYKDYSNSEFMKDFLRVKSDSLLNAKEIRLVCSAAIRLNPYKGFYPAQRTLDLVSQFSSSYGDGLIGQWEHNGVIKPVDIDRMLALRGGVLKPLMQALYSPGLLYNTIKSGIAVDYPIIIDPTKISRSQFGDSTKNTLQSGDNYAICPANIQGGAAAMTTTGYPGGPWFDIRLPFETLLEPQEYINGIQFLDIEPHISASLKVTASLNSQGDGIYELMAKNFFGEVPNFFLKDAEFTKLESGIISDDLRFRIGEVFGARLKIRRSTTGTRTYRFDSGSSGNNSAFTDQGAFAYSSSADGFSSMDSWYPIPQDPQNAKLDPYSPFSETFTMYSRPSAFGPPISGRPPSGSNAATLGAFFLSASLSGAMDCFNGYNWAYTPPYYHGESWVDFIFRPQGNTAYDLQRILAETQLRYWRVDRGVISSSGEPALIKGGEYGAGGWASSAHQPIYSGINVNDNAMQLSASFNLFGIERVLKQTEDKFGGLQSKENTTTGMKWVIQPKFETPMMNFNDTGIHAISASVGTKTLPLYGSASAPNGMWHQFGNIPDKSNVGVFIEMGDIPQQWLKYHYEVNSTGSIYNNFDARNSGSVAPRQIKSLSNLVGFSRGVSRQRLGELADERIIREAVVAIPYVIDELEDFDPPFGKRDNSICDESHMRRKQFIGIPRKRIEAAIKETDGSLAGDSLLTAGASIRKLVQKMQRYVLPPQFDFLQYPNIKPFVMYMFEFEYKFDKNDLSYIWQNLAPRNYKKLTLEAQSISHELMDLELLNEESLFKNDHLRWMVFKVKQKSQSDYYNYIAEQAGHSSKDRTSQFENNSKNPTLGFNWPYDYLSFVELIKFDVDILFKKPAGGTDEEPT